MKYTLTIRELSKQLWHNHFYSQADLFKCLDEICRSCNETGRYPTFSGNGTDEPIDKDEVVITIYSEEEPHAILRPVSAGGDWSAYDDHRLCQKKTQLVDKIDNFIANFDGNLDQLKHEIQAIITTSDCDVPSKQDILQKTMWYLEYCKSSELPIVQNAIKASKLIYDGIALFGSCRPCCPREFGERYAAPLKVKQLMELLSKADPEAPVVQFANGNNGYLDVSHIAEVKLALNRRAGAWGDGPHIADESGTPCVLIS